MKSVWIASFAVAVATLALRPAPVWPGYRVNVGSRDMSPGRDGGLP